MADTPTYAGGTVLGRGQLQLPLRWSAFPCGASSEGAALQRRVVLPAAGLRPGWYHLDAWIKGTDALVTGRVGYVETRRGELPMRLESRGDRRFSKILKISEPVSSISVVADGPMSEGLEAIEFRSLGAIPVWAFMMRKALRYLVANHGSCDLPQAARQFLAAFQTRANLAFRDSYASEDIEAAYPRWRAIHEDPFACRRAAIALDARLAPRRLRIALLVAEGLDPAVASSEIGQSLISSLIDLVPVGLSASTQPALDHCDYWLPVDYSGRFTPGGIERMTLAMIDDRATAAVFADCDALARSGARMQPRLKPTWNRELLWCTDYIHAPLLVRADPALLDALALPNAAAKPAYALALALAERERSTLSHIPHVLFHEWLDEQRDRRRASISVLREHLSRLGHPGTVTQLPDGIQRVSWPVPRRTSVSIMIPSKDKPDLLKDCIDSIRSRTEGIAPQIIVADNGSVQPGTRAYLDRIAADGTAMVVSCPGPFNFPKINNQARRHATGEILVLLNDDTQVISSHWLTELASLARRPEVGAVGCLLLYPDGTIQHAGIVLGIGGAGDHAFRNLPGDAPGYLNLIRCRREISAVTGACLAVSAEHFDAVGGLDEDLPVTLNDVDFCLRLRARGLINIWTPWAVLEHWESKSRGHDFTDAALERQAAELRLFAARWGHLMAQDPNYHPGLSGSEPDYRLAV